MVGCAAGLQAVIIDDFSVPQPLGVTTVDDPSILGGERDLTGGVVAGGVLSGPAFNLIYDGNDDNATEFPATALLGVDLTDGGLSDRFIFEFVSPSDGIAVVDAFSDGPPPAGISTGVFFVAPGVFEVPFATMGGIGTDFTNVTGVAFLYSGQAGASLSLICTGNAAGCVSAVPEPGSLWLFGAGVALAAGWMRRQSRG